MGTYYYIVCHDCKVQQPAARTSSEGAPGHLINSDTHLLPFIVEHAGHNTQCLSEHQEGAHEEYQKYVVKPEWQVEPKGNEAMVTTDWNYTGAPTDPGWYVIEANWREPRSPLVFAAECRDGKLIDADCKIERWSGPYATKDVAELVAFEEIMNEQDASDAAGS